METAAPAHLAYTYLWSGICYLLSCKIKQMDKWEIKGTWGKKEEGCQQESKETNFKSGSIDQIAHRHVKLYYF